MKSRYILSYIIIILFALMRFTNIALLSPTMPLKLQFILAGWYISWYAVQNQSIFILGHFLNKYLPLDKKPFIRMFVQIFISTIVLWIVQFTVVTPFLEYIARGYRINGSIYTIIIGWILLLLMLNVVYFATYFWEYWTRLVLNSERIEKEEAIQERDIAEVQFTQLKNKLNPHFLFNSLAVATDLVYQSPEDTQKFLVQMSKAYRYIVQNYDEPIVALNVEVKFIEDYLELLHTRFQKGFFSEIECISSIENKWIIPLTLQILIENAIKHNTISERHPMYLKIVLDENFLRVENTLKKKKAVFSTSVGLSNLQMQFAHYTSEKISITETDNRFTVHVPLLNQYHNTPNSETTTLQTTNLL